MECSSYWDASCTCAMCVAGYIASYSDVFCCLFRSDVFFKYTQLVPGAPIQSCVAYSDANCACKQCDTTNNYYTDDAGITCSLCMSSIMNATPNVTQLIEQATQRALQTAPVYRSLPGRRVHARAVTRPISTSLQTAALPARDVRASY